MSIRTLIIDSWIDGCLSTMNRRVKGDIPIRAHCDGEGDGDGWTAAITTSDGAARVFVKDTVGVGANPNEATRDSTIAIASLSLSLFPPRFRKEPKRRC